MIKFEFFRRCLDYAKDFPGVIVEVKFPANPELSVFMVVQKSSQNFFYFVKQYDFYVYSKGTTAIIIDRAFFDKVIAESDTTFNKFVEVWGAKW